MKNQYTIQRVQQELTKDIKATPADVRKYFDSLSSDSVPFIPMQVEVQVISIKPTIPQAEIDNNPNINPEDQNPYVQN